MICTCTKGHQKECRWFILNAGQLCQHKGTLCEWLYTFNVLTCWQNIGLEIQMITLGLFYLRKYCCDLESVWLDGNWVRRCNCCNPLRWWSWVRTLRWVRGSLYLPTNDVGKDWHWRRERFTDLLLLQPMFPLSEIKYWKEWFLYCPFYFV